MIRRSFVMSAAALALALGGCGGNKDASPTPTPTPTPTGTPSPTPITYSSLPLLAATEFLTINAWTNYTGDLAVGPVTLGAAGTESRSETARVRLALGTDPLVASSTAPFVVHENGEESRFVKEDLTVAPATTVPEFIFNNVTAATPGKFTRLELLNNTIKDKVTTDAGLALKRVSYGNWLRSDGTTGETRFTSGVFGYPTVARDMPTTGTATYSARIAGRLIRAGAGGTGTLDRLGGTVTVTVNFATGLVSSTLNVTTVDTGGVETPYGSFSGTGAIASGAIQFSGSFGPASPIPGTFAGGFFGAAGEEIGITFAGLGTVGGFDTRAVGAVVGKKN